MLLTISLCMISASVGVVIGGVLTGAKRTDMELRYHHMEQTLLWFRWKYAQQLHSRKPRTEVRTDDLLQIIALVDNESDWEEAGQKRNKAG